MSDNFVPMAPVLASAASNGFTPLQLKSALLSAAKSSPLQSAVSPTASGAARTTSAPAAAAAQNCSQPKITLQRNGDAISRIHIECSCGQVIELDCVY